MSTTADREIVIERLIDAPRALVFEAWTSPEHLGLWWGPKGFTTTTSEMDLRVGGVWRFVMHGPDGKDYPNRITWTEITSPERITYTNGGGDEPENFRSVITFADEGGKTRVTMRVVLPSVAAFDAVKSYAVPGGHSSLECLDEYLKAMDPEGQLVISRVFAAPRAQVFAAWTEPSRLEKWWGPAGMPVRCVKLELRSGGVFHYAMKAPSGDEVFGIFRYREVTPTSRLVFVNAFSDASAGTARHPMSATWPLEVLNVVTFEDEAGATRVTLRGGPYAASAEERATYAASHAGMQQGFKGTMDQLDAYLAQP